MPAPAPTIPPTAPPAGPPKAAPAIAPAAATTQGHGDIAGYRGPGHNLQFSNTEFFHRIGSSWFLGNAPFTISKSVGYLTGLLLPASRKYVPWRG